MRSTVFDCEIVFDSDIRCVDPGYQEEERYLVPKGMCRCPLAPICGRFGEFLNCVDPEPVIFQLSLFFESASVKDGRTEYVFSPYYHPDLFVVFRDDRVYIEWFDGRKAEIDSAEELLSILSRRKTA
jgi:hypothetical protein